MATDLPPPASWEGTRGRVRGIGHGGRRGGLGRGRGGGRGRGHAETLGAPSPPHSAVSEAEGVVAMDAAEVVL